MSSPHRNLIIAKGFTVCLAVTLLCAPTQSPAQTAIEHSTTEEVEIRRIKGKAEIKTAESPFWNAATNFQILPPGASLRVVGPQSWVILREGQRTVQKYRGGSVIRRREGGFTEFLDGVFQFFGRDRPRSYRMKTPAVAGLTRGTEFVMEVKPDGSTRVEVFEGEMLLTNQFGAVIVRAPGAAEATMNSAPRNVAPSPRNTIVQWFLYYPTILNADDIPFLAEDRDQIRESLNHYKAGAFVEAYAAYPWDVQNVSPSMQLYQAALQLLTGQPLKCDTTLEPLLPPGEERLRTLATTLKEFSQFVRTKSAPTPNPGTQRTLSSERLARSYYYQSQSSLWLAREEAEMATQSSPEFGFAWARLAELEFSLGRFKQAEDAAERASELSPRHAHTTTTLAFLRIVRGQPKEAIKLFARAIQQDPGYGSAWLGQGICHYQLGDTEAAFDNLLTAAAIEPNRSEFRSYLGKSFNQEGETAHAQTELELAKSWNQADPSPWLYSALINRNHNRINQAIRDLEESKRLNDNRSIFRSRFQLDQDRSVRGANLAGIYRDAGMIDIGENEAVQAVMQNYANASAHRFLANSYNERRDPGLINQRFDTPWLSEYLLANLLSPVGANPLTPSVSRNDFSQLFERNRLGLTSFTEYLSNGDWTQNIVQHGTTKRFQYALDGVYRSWNGERPNQELEQWTTSIRLKQQITPADTVYLQGTYFNSEAGDLSRYYSPQQASTTFKVKETQEPFLLAGYHHEWTPRSHTLLLGAWVNDTLTVSDPGEPTIHLNELFGAYSIEPPVPLYDVNYRSEYEVYSGDVQHIYETSKHTFVVGGRYQYGELKNRNHMESNIGQADQTFSSTLNRADIYGYYFWDLLDSLTLLGGVTYSHLHYPVNHRFRPISDRETHTDLLAPKAGIIYRPSSHTTIRAAYTRSLGGLSLEQSIRLEPAQIAGFNQSYRSLIPESVNGTEAGVEYDIYGVSFHQAFPSRTYLTLSGEWLTSDAEQVRGIMERQILFSPAMAASTDLNTQYLERSASVSLNQLVGKEWAFGAKYKLSHVELDRRYPDLIQKGTTVVSPVPFRLSEELEATLHRANLFAIFNLPSGFFTRAEANWYSQSNQGYSPDLPSSDFWQYNLFAGLHFWQRRATITVGVLNLNDQDYQLNPLNVTQRLPRSRTFFSSASFSF